MLFRLLVSVSVALLSPLVIAAPEPKLTFPPLLPSPTGPLGPLISRKFVLYPRTRSLRWKEAKPPANTNAHQVLGNIGNADPPALLWTPHPSAQCAVSNGGNGGALQCCRVTVAGDLPIVVFLAKIYGYNLNPNDVNGLVCEFYFPPLLFFRRALYELFFVEGKGAYNPSMIKLAVESSERDE